MYLIFNTAKTKYFPMMSFHFATLLTGPVVFEGEADGGGVAEVLLELTFAFASRSCMT